MNIKPMFDNLRKAVEIKSISAKWTQEMTPFLWLNWFANQLSDRKVSVDLVDIGLRNGRTTDTTPSARAIGAVG